MRMEKAYIPGKQWGKREPLARYLPRIERGVIQTWLEDNIPPGSWVVDLFGASPRLALEAAQAGYRVLVAANNPITRFLLEMAVNNPAKDEMQAVLSQLAAARRGEERLEPHILSLYATECDHCSQEVFVEAFLWKRAEPGPFARIYACPHCDHQGEFPTTQADKDKAAKYTPGSIHRARALERIAPANSPERVYAEEALEVYPPRAMYALSTLVNKLDGLSLSPEQLEVLSALLLSAFDRANTLWRYPSERARPRQLTIPSQYRENNIWFALENAIGEWTNQSSNIEVSRWPKPLPQDGGISIFEGRIKDLVGSLTHIEINAVITAFPRPNQAYWTLAALWSGWLWGQERLGKFASVLRKRRYEWAWHANALQNALLRLAGELKEHTPFYGLVTESEAGFDAAVMVAAEMAGFKLVSIATRPEGKRTQFEWIKDRNRKVKKTSAENSELVRQAAQQLLEKIGQPANYLRLQAAGLAKLASENRLASLGSTTTDIYSESRSVLEFGLTFQSKFRRYGGRESSLETGVWWLKDESQLETPLADRVEKQLVIYLLKNPGSSLHDIEATICKLFPGLQTPKSSLIISALESYGNETNGEWRMRTADLPGARRKDIKDITTLLGKLGKKMHYRVQDGKPTFWEGQAENFNLRFYVIASAVIGDIIFQEKAAEKSYIVIPGGRAGLIMHKLKSDPRLSEALEDGWGLIKFRHVRRLAENQSLTPESWDELIALDQITNKDPQIPLL